MFFRFSLSKLAKQPFLLTMLTFNIQGVLGPPVPPSDAHKCKCFLLVCSVDMRHANRRSCRKITVRKCFCEPSTKKKRPQSSNAGHARYSRVRTNTLMFLNKIIWPCNSASWSGAAIAWGGESYNTRNGSAGGRGRGDEKNNFFLLFLHSFGDFLFSSFPSFPFGKFFL